MRPGTRARRACTPARPARRAHPRAPCSPGHFPAFIARALLGWLGSDAARLEDLLRALEVEGRIAVGLRGDGAGASPRRGAARTRRGGGSAAGLRARGCSGGVDHPARRDGIGGARNEIVGTDDLGRGRRRGRGWRNRRPRRRARAGRGRRTLDRAVASRQNAPTRTAGEHERHPGHRPRHVRRRPRRARAAGGIDAAGSSPCGLRWRETYIADAGCGSRRARRRHHARARRARAARPTAARWSAAPRRSSTPIASSPRCGPAPAAGAPGTRLPRAFTQSATSSALAAATTRSERAQHLGRRRVPVLGTHRHRPGDDRRDLRDRGPIAPSTSPRASARAPASAWAPPR